MKMPKPTAFGPGKNCRLKRSGSLRRVAVWTEREFSWGSEFTPDGKQMANTWQGEFPLENTLEDGFEWTAPVGTFPANAYGLYDVAGNVWEWTTDWYLEHEKITELLLRKRESTRWQSGRRVTIQTCPDSIGRKVMKGGSFLCAPNYCRRYRPAARMAQAVDTSTCHLGFRCVLRIPPATRNDQRTEIKSSVP